MTTVHHGAGALQAVLGRLDTEVPARIGQVTAMSRPDLADACELAMDVLVHNADALWTKRSRQRPDAFDAVSEALAFAAAVGAHRPGGTILADRHWCTDACDTCTSGTPPFPFEWVDTDDRRTGAHFTPRWLAEAVTNNTLTGITRSPGPLDEPDDTKWSVRAFPDLWPVRVCDPAVGAGAFLLAAARFLTDEITKSLAPGIDIPADRIRHMVVEHCLYGVDLNPWSVHITRLALALFVPGMATPGLDAHIVHGDALAGALTEGEDPAVLEARFPSRPLVHWREAFPEVFDV